jgi:hypothetical protein
LFLFVIPRSAQAFTFGDSQDKAFGEAVQCFHEGDIALRQARNVGLGLLRSTV